MCLNDIECSSPTSLTKVSIIKELASSGRRSCLEPQAPKRGKQSNKLKMDMAEKKEKFGSSVAAAGSPMEIIGMGPRDEDESSSSFRTAETLLRLLPIGPCVAALVVMLHNSQTNDFGSVSYSHIGAFRFVIKSSCSPFHHKGCCGYKNLKNSKLKIILGLDFNMT